MTKDKTPRNTVTRTRALAKRGDWRRRFLDALRECGTVRYACDAAGVARSTAYRAREEASTFAEAWDDALEDGLDALEAEARRRALDGTEKPIFHAGVQVGTVREYSDQLLIELLRAHRGKLFRPGGASNVNVAVGVQPTGPSMDEITERIRRGAARLEQLRGLPSGSVLAAFEGD